MQFRFYENSVKMQVSVCCFNYFMIQCHYSEMFQWIDSTYYPPFSFGKKDLKLFSLNGCPSSGDAHIKKFHDIFEQHELVLLNKILEMPQFHHKFT